MSKVTLYFKDILPDLDAFKDAIDEYTSLTKTDATHAFLFKRLYNQYANSNVNYMTPDAFLRHFMMLYESTCDQMKVRMAILAKAYALTDADLVVLSQSINAVANNDDTALSKPLDELAEYVSQQVGNKTNGNLFEAYMTYVEKIKDRYLVEFVRQFRGEFFAFPINEEYFN